MKLRPLTLSLLALAGFAAFDSSASAQTVIRISGAATYRAPTLKAIEGILNPGYRFGYVGANRYRALASIYSGTLINGGQAVIFDVRWTGDVSGIVNLTSRNDVNWLPVAYATDNTKTSTAGVANLANSEISEFAKQDASISVSFAESSAKVIRPANAAGSTAADNILAADLVNAGTGDKAGGVGAIGLAAFQWVTGRVDSAYTTIRNKITNVTQQAAAAVLQGPVPLTYFTGDPADQFRYAFALGRSQDGAARTIPVADAKLGFTTPTYHFQLTFSGTTITTQDGGLQTGGAAATVTGAVPWPANWPLITIPSINYNTTGNSGYNLTSDLANALSALNPVAVQVGTTPTAGKVLINPSDAPSGITEVYFISNNGTADTGALVTAGGKSLTYQGVAYTADAVRTGQYSAWSFAHLYYLGSGTGAITGTAQTAVDQLADAIYTTYAPTNASGVTNEANTDAAGILFDSRVLVTRIVDGDTIYQNY